MIQIWFNLMMFGHGEYFLIETFETYDECHEHQVILEEQMPEFTFACPWIKVEDV